VLHPAERQNGLCKSFRVSTWNVLTLFEVGQQVAIVREINRLNISIAGLTESRIVGGNTITVEGSLLLHSGGCTHTQGLALFLSASLAGSVYSWRPISPRLLYARVAHQRGFLSIVVVYAPTHPSNTENKELVYDQLSSLMTTVPPHDEVVVTGDFNAVSGINKVGYDKVLGPFGSGTPNDNTDHFLSFCAPYNLYILGSWFKRKHIHRLTWFFKTGRTTK